MKENEDFNFYFPVVVLAGCVLIVSFNKLFYGDSGGLVNILCVGAQLSCILFHQRYAAKTRLLLLLCFFLSIFCNLYLVSIDGEVLLRVLLIFFLVFLFIIFLTLWGWGLPLEVAYSLLFLFYLLHPKLALWGFYLAFLLFWYHALEFLFEGRKSSATQA